MDVPGLVHEQLVLLILDSAKGTSISPYADRALAGAVVLDLVQAGMGRVDGETLAVTSTPGDGILGEVAAVIAGESKPRTTRWWIEQLPGKFAPFLPRLAHPLVEKGILSEEHKRILGLIATTRFPQRESAPATAVRERLHEVLLGRREPELSDAMLASMLDALDALRVVVAKGELRQARSRSKEMSANLPIAGVAGQAVESAQTAVAAAIVATTVATSVTTSTAATT